jgi:hypothetical protein
MSTFTGSKPTQGTTTGISNANSVTWNDESTLGAPCEDPEYGAGDPERVLELSSGGNLQYAGKSLVEKNQMEDDTSITELMKQRQHQHQHQYSLSTTSFPSRT